MFSVGLATLKEWEWECVGNHLVGRLQKRFIDSTNGCLRKRGLNVGQAGRITIYIFIICGFTSILDQV